MTPSKASPASSAEIALPADRASVTGAVERPVRCGVEEPAVFGSDVIAETLRALGIPYIALNPGASYRGLHDSLVNYLGNDKPQILLCLHEESAVAIAHGYAKVTGRPMATAVHSNVGLMHATMAIYNAWCDRMPVIVLGATGPVDAAKRRPWIDWIHTARDQGALVRSYVKWDDQPASPLAAREAILRAAWLASTNPKAPVYVNLDAEMQEGRLVKPIAPIDTARYTSEASSAAPRDFIHNVAAALKHAKRPVILAGRASRSLEAWNARIALAEGLRTRVVTDLKVGASFPTDHPLHVGLPETLMPSADAREALMAADVILSLDWVDLAGTLRAACGDSAKATVIQVSLDHTLHNGWSMDYQGLPPVDLFVAADHEVIVPALLEELRIGPTSRSYKKNTITLSDPSDEQVTIALLAHSLRKATGDRTVSLTHLPLSWHGSYWPFRHPLDYLGSDGGGGIGGGPGISVGAALALQGTGRLPIAICGDGDFLMGVTCLWTAVHYRVPLLVVVANNRSFYNDEMHQERMARMRNRPIENKWIGQRMSDPEIDIAAMAKAQGAVGLGPVKQGRDLASTFEEAISVIDGGGVAVVDVHVEPGYASTTSRTLIRDPE